MEQGTEHQHYLNDGIENAYRLSWTAYVWPVVIVLFFWSIALALYQWKPWVGVAFFLFWLLILISGFLSRRAIRLYTNDHGVWVRSGFLPWTKGVSGVQWRDIDDAVYFTGFLAWAFNSYRIRVGHRFTRTSEIVIGSVADGRKFVEAVNRELIERHRRASIERAGESLG